MLVKYHTWMVWDWDGFTVECHFFQRKLRPENLSASNEQKQCTRPLGTRHVIHISNVYEP